MSENTRTNREVYNGRRKIVGFHEDEWVTEDLVSKVIDGLAHKRCEGYDRIPLQFLIDGKEKLLTIITVLMSKVINHGNVPEQWKIAKVKPLHKKGNRKIISNYRPISNLSSITKIFEKLILERIGEIGTRENTDLTGLSQHGFKKNCSTDMACLELQSIIASHCDAGDFVAVCSLDLTSAFDVVNVKLLIKRLQIIGLPVQLVNVIEDWLTDRYFYCVINGRSSALKQLLNGTVQGSILGPLLFALFIAPLEDMVGLLVSFADDNYNIGAAGTENEALDKCVVQSTIMIDWLNASGLCVNATKTEVCVFSRKNCFERTVELKGNVIDIRDNMRILGVIFDSKLTWYSQVMNAVQSANKAKQGLNIIAKYFNPNEMLILATAYFYSRLYYGARIWLISTLSAKLKKTLWQTSSRMLRIVDKDYRCVNSFVTLHKKYRRATPEMWGNYSTACALHHVFTTQKPTSIINGLTMNVLHEERRQGLKFTRSNCVKIGFNCLSNRVQNVSGKMSFNWMDMPNLSFKRTCKQIFIGDPLSRL